MRRLEEQIRFRERSLVLQDLVRAEELALLLDTGVTYPEDWVFFRITGAQLALSHPDVLGGDELRGELSVLVERLSAGVHHRVAEAGQVVDAAALCRHWSVSKQTLARLRRRGLVGRRVVDASKRARLVFRTEIANKFQGAHREALLKASGFTRLGPEQEAKILERAGELRNARNLTLNQAAALIAKELDRSHEGIRQVLRRAEARAKGAKAAPVFGEAPALSRKQQEVLYRAWRRGVDLGLMARKSRRSRGAVRRAINVARARRLLELAERGALAAPAAPAFSAKNAAETILSPAPVRTGLGTPAAADVLAFLRQAHGQGPPIGAEEKARLVAYQFLRFEAARLIGKLDRLQPSAGALDRVETMLRWAARLKAELVRSQLKVMLEALHARLERPVEQLPAGVLVQLLTAAIGAVGDAVDAFDPVRSGRLAAGAGLAVDKVAIQWSKQLAPSGAGAKRATVMIPSGLAMPDWTRGMAPWQGFLEPDRRLRGVLGRLPRDAAEFLGRRYGYDGGPPLTLAALAKARGVNQVAVFRFEQSALQECSRIVRQ